MSFWTLDPRLPSLEVSVDVTNLPTNPVRVWTDITRQVRRLTYTRSGRNDELQRTTPGTLTAVCDNRADAVTSLGIRKAQWVRVRAQWAGVTYPRWQGIFESVPRQWPSAGHDATIELHALDVLKVFRLFDMGGQTFGVQRNDQRVAAIAALASVPSGTIDTDTDTADAVATPMSVGTDALSTLLELEASENGLLLADPAGTLSFQGRHWRLLNSGTSVASFAEGYGIPYRDSVVYEDDDTRVANIVNVTPSGSTTAVSVSDTSSQGTYFTRTLSRSLLTSSAAVATDAANYLLRKYKDPSPRIPAVTVDLAAVPASLLPVVLAANNSTRFTWTRQAATPITAPVYVEQIQETVSPGVSWQTGFQLSPANDESGWVLGDATLGVLGSTTRLTY